MKHVTMADVARTLGVHPSTVSMALRRHPRISQETCELVRKTADAMGYRPNPLVSALIAERRKGRIPQKGSTLAFLTAAPRRHDWKKSQNYVILYEEIVKQASFRGYRVEEFWLHDEGMTPEHLKDIFIYRGIRGIIVCPLPGIRHHIDFDFTDFAGVALGLTLRSPRIDHVATDYYSVMTAAIDRLLETGHRRIAFMADLPFNDRVNDLSLGAFLAKRHRFPRILLPPCLTANWQSDDTRQNLLHWIRQKEPDAIILPTRREYKDTKSWLSTEGLSIPKDLSLLCLDCLPGTSQSGIVQDLPLQAYSTVEWVTSRVERAEFGGGRVPQSIFIPGTFQEGSTFLPRPAPHPRK